MNLTLQNNNKTYKCTQTLSHLVDYTLTIRKNLLKCLLLAALVSV